MSSITCSGDKANYIKGFAFSFFLHIVIFLVFIIFTILIEREKVPAIQIIELEISAFTEEKPAAGPKQMALAHVEEIKPMTEPVKPVEQVKPITKPKPANLPKPVPQPVVTTPPPVTEPVTDSSDEATAYVEASPVENSEDTDNTDHQEVASSQSTSSASEGQQAQSAAIGGGGGDSSSSGSPAVPKTFINSFLGLVEREKKYPTDARKAGIEGTIKVQVEFNESGNIVNMSLVPGNYHPLLSEATIKTMENVRLRWRPPRRGLESPQIIIIPIKYELKSAI